MKRNIILICLLAAISLLPSCATQHRAEILFETTKGDFKMALFNETPLHRDAYLLLTKCGFFDSLLLHRVVKNFVVQGGDPDSRHAKPRQELGNGEPFRIPAEIHFPKFYHKRGMVLAAREGDDVNPKRESCASQFAIVTTGPLTDAQIEKQQQKLKAMNPPIILTKKMIHDYKTVGGTPHLDGQYTIFGEIVEGMNVIDSIQNVAVDKNDRPLQDVRILKAVVIKDK